MDTKICSRCQLSKPLTDYYKDKRAKDGLYSHCKACHYNFTHSYEQSEHGKQIVSQSKRTAYWQRGGKDKARSRNSQAEAKAARAAYLQTEQGKASMRRKYTKRKMLHSDKIRAKKAVQVAVKNGILPPVASLACSHCGEQASEYHHNSYLRADWLKVTPLCKDCHATTYTQPYQS